MHGVVLVLGLAAPVHQRVEQRQGLAQLGPHAVRGLEQIVPHGVRHARALVVVGGFARPGRRPRDLVAPALLEARETRAREERPLLLGDVVLQVALQFLAQPRRPEVAEVLRGPLRAHGGVDRRREDPPGVLGVLVKKQRAGQHHREQNGQVGLHRYGWSLVPLSCCGSPVQHFVAVGVCPAPLLVRSCEL